MIPKALQAPIHCVSTPLYWKGISTPSPQKCVPAGHLIVLPRILDPGDKEQKAAGESNAWLGTPSDYMAVCPVAASVLVWLKLPSWTSLMHAEISTCAGCVDKADVSQALGSGPGTSQYKMRKGKKTGNPTHHAHPIVQEKCLLDRPVVSKGSDSCCLGMADFGNLWDSRIPSPPLPSLLRPLPFFGAQLKCCPLLLSNPRHTVSPSALCWNYFLSHVDSK